MVSLIHSLYFSASSNRKLSCFRLGLDVSSQLPCLHLCLFSFLQLCVEELPGWQVTETLLGSLKQERKLHRERCLTEGMWAGLRAWVQGLGAWKAPLHLSSAFLCTWSTVCRFPAHVVGRGLHQGQGGYASSKGTVLCPTSPGGPSLVRLGHMTTLSQSAPSSWGGG